MKNRLLIYFIASVTLVSTTDASSSFVADTVPETNVKKKEVKEKDEFSEIEKDLDSLSKQTQDNDTTKIRIGKMKISVTDDGNDIVINKDELDDDWDDDWDWDNDKDFSFGRKHDKNRFEPHWAGIALGMNGYLNSSQQMELPEGYDYLELNTNKSVQFDLNIYQLGINIVKERIGLVSGVGFRWNNYRFSNSDVVLFKSNGVLDHRIDTQNDYNKSKLSVTYLTVPLLLEFQVPLKNEDLYLSGGVEGGVKLTAKMKNKSDDGDKDKSKDDFYINPFTYNLAARIGYGNFGFYGVYQMQQLFQKDKGPELYPFALGVTLNF